MEHTRGLILMVKKIYLSSIEENVFLKKPQVSEHLDVRHLNISFNCIAELTEKKGKEAPPRSRKREMQKKESEDEKDQELKATE